MAQVPRARRPETKKYTLLVDREIQDYQARLKQRSNVNFSDLIRAAIKRIASDAQLEAELFTAVGGGYYDDDDSDQGEVAPQEQDTVVSPTEPPAVETTAPVAVENTDGDFWPADA